MALENYSYLMAIIMKAILKKESSTVKVRFNLKTDPFMKEILKKEKKKAEEYIYINKEISTKDNFRMTCQMELESILFLRVKNMKETSKMER